MPRPHSHGPNQENDTPATETVVTLTTNRGELVLCFFPDSAPEYVKNFVWHAENTCPGFMIQDGHPNTRPAGKGMPGTGGYSYLGEGTSMPAEFNEHKHKRGILSMARSQDSGSAGSQFVVMHGETDFLDGQHTVYRRRRGL